jgi:hypothetical protein
MFGVFVPEEPWSFGLQKFMMKNGYYEAMQQQLEVEGLTSKQEETSEEST